MLYLQTSMYPGQRLLTALEVQQSQLGIEQHVSSILTMASRLIQIERFELRSIVFPLFIAGFATNKPDVKARAAELIRFMEPHGISQNTKRTRQLLVAVSEEQRRRAQAGRRAEEVDWMAVARERGLMVVNCGL